MKKKEKEAISEEKKYQQNTRRNDFKSTYTAEVCHGVLSIRGAHISFFLSLCVSHCWSVTRVSPRKRKRPLFTWYESHVLPCSCPWTSFTTFAFTVRPYLSCDKEATISPSFLSFGRIKSGHIRLGPYIREKSPEQKCQGRTYHESLLRALSAKIDLGRELREAYS